jgi:hypothetical protein
MQPADKLKITMIVGPALKLYYPNDTPQKEAITTKNLQCYCGSGDGLK